MLRVSATTIEAYRLFMTADWMAEEELIAQIKGVFVPDRKIELGTNFDNVLTDPDKYRVDGGFRAAGDLFSSDLMAEPLRLMDRRGVAQVKATKDYGDIQIVCKADRLIGAELVENKTTLGTFDADKYERSFQWRLMADIFEPLQITYHVFCLSDDDAGQIALRSIESIHFYPYDALHQDCAELVREFRHYVETRGLVALLEQRHRDAAGIGDFSEECIRRFTRSPRADSRVAVEIWQPRGVRAGHVCDGSRGVCRRREIQRSAEVRVPGPRVVLALVE